MWSRRQELPIRVMSGTLGLILWGFAVAILVGVAITRDWNRQLGFLVIVNFLLGAFNLLYALRECRIDTRGVTVRNACKTVRIPIDQAHAFRPLIRKRTGAATCPLPGA